MGKLLTGMTRGDWALVGVAVLMRLVYHLSTGFIADDAFITFRYAENVAGGVGFVYNAGEKVLGTTSPLWTLILASFHLIGIPPAVTSIALSIACGAVTVLLIRRIAAAIGLGNLAYLTSLIYALWPRSTMAETSGMEMALFTMLVAAFMWWGLRNEHIGVMLSASLATLVRPEGALLLLLALLSLAWKQTRSFGRPIVLAGVLLIPWIVFATVQFGSPLPTSITGKLALYGFEVGSTWSRLSYILALHSPAGILMSSMSVAGMLISWHRKSRIGWEIIFALVLILGYSLAPTHLFFWYLAPIQIVLILTAGVAVHSMAERVRVEWSTTAVTMAAAGVTLLSAYGILQMIRSSQNMQLQQMVIHKAIGVYLSEHADASATIAAEDVGYIGYYSNRRILDRDGLVSPEVHEFNIRHDYYGVIAELNPDWVVADTAHPPSSFIREGRFTSRYQFDRAFTDGERQYEVFRRTIRSE